MFTLPTTHFDESQVQLPYYEGLTDHKAHEADFYSKFMRHLSAVPASHPAIKILSSIQFTADFLGYSDAHVTKVLVDLGLRAPRKAFPAEFLDFIDAALLRTEWEIGAPSESLLELADHWRKIGEDPFVAARRKYDLVDEEAFV